MKIYSSSCLVVLFVLLLASSCSNASSAFDQPTETTDFEVFTETQFSPIGNTQTPRLFPTFTQTPLPSSIPTPTSTRTLPPLADWRIGYTVIVIPDKSNPENHHLEIRTIQLNVQQPELIEQGDTDTYKPKWSPDGKWLAYLSSKEGHPPATSLIVLETITGYSHEIMNVNLFEWSSDSQSIIYTSFGQPFVQSSEHTYYLVSVNDLEHPRIFFVAPWVASRLAWSPAGDHILAVGYAEVGDDLANYAYLIDLEGNIQQIALQEIPHDLSWHPSGEQFVYEYSVDGISTPAHIHIFDLITQEEWELTHDGEVASFPVFSSDGKYLAYVSTPIGLALTKRSNICILNLEKKETAKLGRSYQNLSFPTWSPDGNYLAYIFLIEPDNWPFPWSFSLNVYEIQTGRYLQIVDKGLERLPPVWLPR